MRRRRRAQLPHNDLKAVFSRQPNVCTFVRRQREFIHSVDCGGGGYGDPFTRDSRRILEDDREEWVSHEAAREEYGVAMATEDVGRAGRA